MRSELNPRPLVATAMVLGVGMGGFIDGIVLHQMLQIHNMLSNRWFPDTLVNAEINMFWDGLFHAFTWIVTAVGIAMLFRIARRPEIPWSKMILLGGMLMGWGLFNFVEGLIDHHILQIHHVVQRAEGSERLAWDLAFLATGPVFGFIGWSMVRREQRHLSSNRMHQPQFA